MYRRRGGALEVLLVHPGGPFWGKKDLGAWLIPNGEMTEGEDALTVAQREFEEETGFRAHGTFVDVGSIRQKGVKTVRAWGVEGGLDPAAIRSNTFTMEYPPRSGRTQELPEVGRAAFFLLADAHLQVPWLLSWRST
jgi:predicted NUDIX family NTP pyrophosphohydrolase